MFFRSSISATSKYRRESSSSTTTSTTSSFYRSTSNQGSTSRQSQATITSHNNVVEKKYFQQSLDVRSLHQDEPSKQLNLSPGITPQCSPEINLKLTNTFIQNEIEKKEEEKKENEEKEERKPPKTLFDMLQYKDRINFLVRGKLYQTFETTLNKFPGGLLGNSELRNQFYNSNYNVYVFNRCSRSFDAILFYYQSNGVLARPADVPRLQFLEELEFYKITKFLDKRQEKDCYHIKRLFIENSVLPNGAMAQNIWCLLQFKSKSNFGYIWKLFHLIIVIASICIITLFPEVHYTHDWVTIMDLTFNVFFTIEFATHVYVSPSFKRFLISTTGMVDCLSVVFYWLNLCIYLLRISNVHLTRFTKLLLFVRTLKLCKFIHRIRYVIYTIKESRSSLNILIVSIGLSSLWFATVIFYVETDFGSDIENGSLITSLPDGVWYAMITCTGVGYGDIYPITVTGKLFGGALAVLGLLLFCLPISILVNKFVECYYLAEAFEEDTSESNRAKVLAMRELFLSEL